MSNEIAWEGPEVLQNLAEIFQQLHLTPGEEGARWYPEVVLKGKQPPVRSLAHFHTTPGDLCRYEQTPAGEVRVVTLCDRRDFETFIQIMSERCKPVPIPRTQGAAILDGVINRRKISRLQKEFYERKPGAAPLEWKRELDAFLKDRSNYTEALIVLSIGPYSNVPWESTGFSETEWLTHSQVIRHYHECTHFVCRRLYRHLIDAIWDEVVADAVGIRAALGRYAPALAETVLGISEGRYTGGRLENYVPGDTPHRADALNDLAEKIHSVIGELGRVSEACASHDPFEFAIALEEQKSQIWP